MNEHFGALGIGAALVHPLERRGIRRPTAIQERAIPHLLAGGDALIRSQTGTGKTLAYLLPAVQRMSFDEGKKDLQTLVIVPTRELGAQVAAEAMKLEAHPDMAAQLLIGGASLQRQVEKLRAHPQLAVGTPGRLLELIRMKKLKMHRVRTIIVDEADQVFLLGAGGEVEEILRSALRGRQIVFCSATMPDEVRRTAERWMSEPAFLLPEDGGLVPERIEHHFFVCEKRDKIDLLRRLLRHYRPRSAIVFVNETEAIGELEAKLLYGGLSVRALYGDSPKAERTTVLNRFREAAFHILIATDIAARGLDLEGVNHIFHFDPAPDPDHYLHRSGRTGRMGRKGFSVSIIVPQERFILDKFANSLGVSFLHKSVREGKIVDGNPPPALASSRTREKRPRPPAKAEESGIAGRKAAAERPKRPADKRKRRKDQKNKGAPRWLKEKQEADRKA